MCMSSAQHPKEPWLIMNTDPPAITIVNFFHEKYLLNWLWINIIIMVIHWVQRNWYHWDTLLHVVVASFPGSTRARTKMESWAGSGNEANVVVVSSIFSLTHFANNNLSYHGKRSAQLQVWCLWDTVQSSFKWLIWIHWKRVILLLFGAGSVSNQWNSYPVSD